MIIGCTAGAVWLGVCLGAEHVGRVEDSTFLRPGTVPTDKREMSDFAGEEV